MKNKKLERWAEQLLDTGKRNNLVSFKDTRASTLEVVSPTPEDLFGKVGGTTSLEVFDPKIYEDDEEYYNPDESIEDKEKRFNREEYITKYGKHLKRNQILVYSSSLNPITVLKNIDKKAKSTVEETGVNVAYLAFGFIHWKEHDESNEEYRAPILLVPITFENDSAIHPYFMKMAEDEIVINPTFAFKMLADRNVKMPEYGDDEDIDTYLDRVANAVEKLHWTVSRECKMGIFSFQKVNMYRDLMDNQEKILANRNINVLLGEDGYDSASDIDIDVESIVRNELVDLHTVVDADSSQIEAIEMAKSGKSFVIQGPPGTGKSQTITNLISECLADGKKVLFVSEKLAALNVVYDKLKKAGLEEFCLELHSHKANKKDVIAELCRTLALNKTSVSSRADNEIQAKEHAQKQLDEYAKALHTIEPIINLSPYQLYSAYSHFKGVPDIRYAIPNVNKKSQENLIEDCQLLEEYIGFIPTIGDDYQQNCLFGYSSNQTYDGILESQEDFQEAAEVTRELLTYADDLSSIGINAKNINQIKCWIEAIGLFEESQTVTPALFERVRFNAAKEKVMSASRYADNYLKLRTNILNDFDEGIFEIDGSQSHKTLSEKYSGFFSRLFSSEYKGIINLYRKHQKSSKKLKYEQTLEASKVLSDYQKVEREYYEIEPDIKACIGENYKGISSNWIVIRDDMDNIDYLYNIGLDFSGFANITMEDFNSKRNEIANMLKEIMSLFDKRGRCINSIANAFDRIVFDMAETPLSSAAARISECDKYSVYLDNWYRFNDLLERIAQKGLQSYILYVTGNKISPDLIIDDYRKAYYRQWISEILQKRPVLKSFNRLSQDQAVRVFGEKDNLQFEINKLRIKSGLSQTRPSLNMVAAGSPIQTIQREGQKKRRQMNIRSLFAETGELVQILKPCFLMSPLSVSTYLGSDNIHFDTVIFDEASQIFPQDAVGAIYRGKQLIVVGDSRQMPPSNFFNTTTEIEDLDEESGDVTDFESILDICTGCMPQLRLNWHYRSRYEQLISFSNRNFYDNSLVTFPSSTSDGKWVGVDYYYVNGCFDRRSKTNREEAEFVVDLIYQNIEKFPNRSLGVVAFSASQQDIIDKLLSRRRQEDPSKEEYFSSSAKEPFFIKNLETVQGDERDTIIFSIAYGRDAQGRLLMNFGPLNRQGGERRLNVAVTRAKSNVQLISSMHATDIDLTRTESKGARLLREYLDYAEHGDIALERTIDVNPLNWFDSDFETEVYDYLTDNGFSVDTQVGCSTFRIDLGLKIPGTSKYVLAIECDGATYHSSRNARDRDRLRQQILGRMGWKFYRIWSTDWFKNKEVEKERLIDECNKALMNPSMENVSNDDTKSSQIMEDISDFEMIDGTNAFSFPKYQALDVSEYVCTGDFVEGIRKILETENPLSEEWLLQRLAPFFGRTRVTSVVRNEYNWRMQYLARYGITQKKGFLYLNDCKEYSLRVPGDEREVKYIAPEELAAGMIEIIRINISITKEALYQTLGKVLGVSRIGEAISQHFDEAFKLIKKEIVIKDNVISLKQ